MRNVVKMARNAPPKIAVSRLARHCTKPVFHSSQKRNFLPKLVKNTQKMMAALRFMPFSAVRCFDGQWSWLRLQISRCARVESVTILDSRSALCWSRTRNSDVRTSKIVGICARRSRQWKDQPKFDFHRWHSVESNGANKNDFWPEHWKMFGRCALVHRTKRRWKCYSAKSMILSNLLRLKLELRMFGDHSNCCIKERDGVFEGEIQTNFWQETRRLGLSKRYDLRGGSI